MIRREPTAVISDDVAFVRDAVAQETPEIAARIDRAQAAVADLEARLKSVSAGTPESVAYYAPRTASRMTPSEAAPVARRQAWSIGRQLETARQELATAVRTAQREVGLIEGPRAVANEIARVADDYARMPIQAKHALLRSAVSELLDNGRVTMTGPLADAVTLRQAPDTARMFDAQDDAADFRQLPGSKGTDLAEAEQALRASQDALLAQSIIRPMSRDQLDEIAAADQMVARAEAEARAYDVATACALGRP